MPYRVTPIVVNEIYHVYNRSIAKQPIFISSQNYHRALDTFTFYQYEDLPMRFSFYNRLSRDQKRVVFSKLVQLNRIVDIISYCLMPNHIHFLLKNVKENGVSSFMRNFQNSYAKYFNTKTNRTGSLFQSMFKLKRIETEEQLIHVSRYIHLNPVTAYLINPERLKNYPWSSYPSYLQSTQNFINKKIILNTFKSPHEYEKFVLDQVDYQRELDKIKHLLFE